MFAISPSTERQRKQIPEELTNSSLGKERHAEEGIKDQTIIIRHQSIVRRNLDSIPSGDDGNGPQRVYLRMPPSLGRSGPTLSI